MLLYLLRTPQYIYAAVSPTHTPVHQAPRIACTRPNTFTRTENGCGATRQRRMRNGCSKSSSYATSGTDIGYAGVVATRCPLLTSAMRLPDAPLPPYASARRCPVLT
eukprot:3940713-Rhodomonas_salina.1